MVIDRGISLGRHGKGNGGDSPERGRTGEGVCVPVGVEVRWKTGRPLRLPGRVDTGDRPRDIKEGNRP